MSTPPASPPHATAWALGVFAVILLYLLSAPVVGVTALRTDYGPRMHAYMTPYYWLEHHPPLNGLLDEYYDWWFIRIGSMP